jgi:hypothetical protein
MRFCVEGSGAAAAARLQNRIVDQPGAPGPDFRTWESTNFNPQQTVILSEIRRVKRGE